MSDPLKSFMKQHPVASFFVLAYAISWVLWVPAVLVWKLSDQMPWWGMPAYLVGTFAPTFAALAVTGILEGKPGVKLAFRTFPKGLSCGKIVALALKARCRNARDVGRS